MPNVVTYCRVSSEEQAQKDLSIPAQRKALLRWVDEQPDHHILDQFVDQGISAYAPADKRPGFCEMVAYCRKNDVQLILVHKLDRFSRNREESILFKSLLRRHGVAIKSVTEHFDAETPQGFLYEGMIEVINQFYSMNLATETMKGMRENAERGYHNGGRTPYGYRVEKIADANGREHGRLTFGPDEEVAVLRDMFDMAANRGMGGRTIANDLNSREIRAPRSRHWNASSVKSILDNPVYVGDTVWGRTRKNGRASRRRVSEDEYTVVRDTHPAIVDRETWDKHKVAAKSRRFDARKSPGAHVNYLLGRLMTCGHCGSRFVGRRHSYKDRKGVKVVNLTYYCGGYLNKGRSVCRSLPIGKAWVEDFVLGVIKDRLCEEDAWSELEGELRERIEARRRRYGQDPETAAQRVVDIERRIQNYYRAIGDGMDPKVCQKLIAELTAKKEGIETEATVLQKEDYYTRALEQNLAILERFRAAFSQGFDELPFSVRRQVVLAFVEEIRVVERREVRVRFKVPFDNQGITHLTDEMVAVIDGVPETQKGPALSVDPLLPGFVCHPGTKWLCLSDWI